MYDAVLSVFCYLLISVSVLFSSFVCAGNIYSSVKVTESQPSGKELFAQLAVLSPCILSFCNFSYFPSRF